MWEPIALEHLLTIMSSTDDLLEGDLFKFWQLIRITPEKWQEEEFGKDGGGFWAVAIAGKKVIWYNDIEDGFNLSNYTKYGEVETYSCDQYELNHIIWQLYCSGEHGTYTAGRPEKNTL